MPSPLSSAPRPYPTVVDEYATLQALLDGHSIARFGDGELSHALGLGSKWQASSAALTACLRRILWEPGRCLVGIPRIVPTSRKFAFWRRWLAPDVCALLNPQVPYYSAFISRPDSSPLPFTPAYWQRVRQLWADKDVVLVRGSDKSLTPARLPEARSVREVRGPAQHGFAACATLEAAIGDAPLVVLCLGMTATVLAWRLANRGHQALDLGHIGMFLPKTVEDSA
jgi:Glycosyltransferase GT-D fold